ncbi:hydrogenase maturation protease [Promethearchaeum syntrophicum]|uniref:Hydrogenase maturation protease n=1 Tax=Promethearchaeum syntrophicum TaxID=2594042 RepID=A0A5B9DH86_9ARCH|nr:hydrogenase maturation protease [Candidatus Prometheoarchaeum syntrophicum]QEE18103.1 hydrogenase 3 maturation protease [Candidatus Prometheoarchaeum syntrophicum]
MDLKEKYKNLNLSLTNLLKSSPKLLILGIGENRMGDDGAGVYITWELWQKWKNKTKISIINGGITPEERLPEIIDFQPELVLIVDVIDLKKPSGTIGIFEEDKILNYLPISSHSLPLPVFIDRIQRGVSGVDIKLVGICPYSLKFLETYQLYREDLWDLDMKENNPNIPFYSFNLTKEMEEVCKELIFVLNEILKLYY